jgi:hypothetical protein
MPLTDQNSTVPTCRPALTVSRARSRAQGGAYASLVEAQVQRAAEKLSIGVETVHEILNNSARCRFRRAVLGVNAINRFVAAGKVATASTLATRQKPVPVPATK